MFDAFYYGDACRYLELQKLELNYVLGHEVIIKSNVSLHSSLWKVYDNFRSSKVIFDNVFNKKSNPSFSRFVKINESAFAILFIENLYKIESVNNNSCTKTIYHFTAKPKDDICNDGLPYISSNKTISKRIDCYCPYSTKGRFCKSLIEECPTKSLFCMKQYKYYVIICGWILVSVGIIIFTIVLLRHSKRTSIFIAPFVDDRPFVYHLENHLRCVYLDCEENELYHKLETIFLEVYKEKGEQMNY
uniref:EGF-like domain-containing protein n=1 Tax=Strongyloides papillosus TaxID=174720 RepID=A0A0N5B607_STREA